MSKAMTDTEAKGMRFVRAKDAETTARLIRSMANDAGFVMVGAEDLILMINGLRDQANELVSLRSLVAGGWASGQKL